MHHALTEEVANQAIKYFDFMFEDIRDDGYAKRDQWFITVGYRGENGEYIEVASRGHSPAAEFERPFDLIARSKAAITARTGYTSHFVQTQMPWLRLEGETEYWGSAIGSNIHGTIVVAMSGLDPEMDEAISKSIVAMLLAMTILNSWIDPDIFDDEE